MNSIITLTSAGEDTGPFNLFSNIDGFITPFETNVAKSTLLAGFFSSLIPDFTSSIRIKSIGICNNFIDVLLQPTTTTTTTNLLTTTTTTTASYFTYSLRIGYGELSGTVSSNCDSVAPNALLYSSDSVLVIGSVLFIDFDLTIPYIGSELWFRFSTSDASIQIGYDGSVLDIVSCVSTTTTTTTI